MHPNTSFRWEDHAALRAFATDIGFGVLFAATPDGPRAAHLPFVFLDDDRIAFHIARSNAITRHLPGAEALLVVNGADAYVSPDWYGMADQVPTWNYQAVEYQGRITPLEREALVAQVDALSDSREARLAPKPVWTRGKMSDGLFEKMLRGIVGFELRISDVRGTSKLGQNKPKAARRGLADALDAQGKAEMAALTRNLPS